MNLVQVKKHVESLTVKDFMKLAKDGSNKSAFFCADVVGNRKFAQNYGGWPRSDIAEINDAASEQEMMYLLSQLTDYTPQSNPNAGLSDAEIMLGHKSKYLQSATEMQGWIEEQIAIRDAKAKAQADASSDGSNGNTIKFEDNVDS